MYLNCVESNCQFQGYGGPLTLILPLEFVLMPFTIVNIFTGVQTVHYGVGVISDVRFSWEINVDMLSFLLVLKLVSSPIRS